MLLKRNLCNIFLLLLPIIYILFYQLYLFNNLLKYIEFITAAVMIFIVAISILLLGFSKCRQTMMMKNLKRMTITYIIMFFAVTYGAGLFLGFLKNSYSLSFYSIIDNVFAPIITIICCEIFRYNMIRSNKDKKYMVKIVTVILILLEITLSVKPSAFSNFESIFRMVTSIALPIIMKNALLSYLCYHVGYQSTLIYRLILDVYVFVMPIVPDLGEYLTSITGIGFPFLIYIFASRLIDEDENGVEHVFNAKRFGPADVVMIGIIACLSALCSGMLPWYVIGVASESMGPQINKGDAVVIKKIKSSKELEVGSVISFYKDGKEVVHRLMDVVDQNGKSCYITKGDANPTVDFGCVFYEDIYGVVKTKIPYVAYPRVLITEYLN